MQTILLIRHGYLSSWDDKPKARGAPPHHLIDPGLAQQGRAQAQRCSITVAAGGDLTIIRSSPFRSCLETADVLAGSCRVAIQPDWRLGEVLLSTVLGRPFSPTAGMDPDWADRRMGAGKPSHPESDRTIAERVAKVVLELKALKPFAQRIAIVSHAIILRELATAMTGRPVSIDWHPGAITTLKRDKPLDRTWRLAGALADATHLGPDDRSEPVDQIVHRYHPLDSRS